MAQADPASRKRTRKTKAEASAVAAAVEPEPGVTAATAAAAAAAAAAAGPAPTLRILDTRVLRGPNYWAREPVIRQVVDLGVLEEWPSNRIPGFVDALVELVPTLEDHACSLGRRGGFITRLRDGTWAGHVAEHVALEFQNLAGTDVRHGKTRGTGEYGRYNVIFEYREEQVGIEAGRMAVGLVNHLVAPEDPDHAFDFVAELENLIRLAERLAFGPSTQALLDEAVSRDIPYIRLDRYSLVQLGQGVHQQRIRATMTSRTSGDRGGHRVRQEAHQPPAGLRRPARAALRGGRDRGRRRRRGAAPGLPVRGQAAGRQPRPRRRPGPARRGRRPRGVPGGAAPEPPRRRRRRDLHHRQRLPLPGHRRQARGGRGARPGQRDRRRREDGPRARRHHQRAIRAAASATRRSSPGSSWTRTPRSCSGTRASRPTASRPRVPS